MAAPQPPMNVDAASIQVKRLINVQLKQVCKGAGLPVSGAKAALQSRIINHLHGFARANNYDAFSRLRSLIHRPELESNAFSPSYAPSRPHPSHAVHSQAQHIGGLGTASQRSPSFLPASTTPRIPLFRSSPFYTILEPLTSVLECKVRETTRDSVQATIILRPDIVDEMTRDTTMRAMVYCSADSTASPFTKVEIAFPHQVEIKVNQDEIKANLRGLKNKPGTTRPADITDLLRKRAGYENSLLVTYALTQKRFFVVVNLVRQDPVEKLVAQLRNGKSISKERVIHEMVSRSQDNDIVAVTTIMSLKCPLSTLRIDTPCRSSMCTHNQCFDATSFLQLQEQAPTWTCPLCNKIVTFENLHVDQYVNDVLASTPKQVEQVIIEPNGVWKIQANQSPAKTNNRAASSDSEGDVSEIREARSFAPVKTEGGHELGRNVTQNSRSEDNLKRPVSAVVDLTLSDDEEEFTQAEKTIPNGLSTPTLPTTH